MDHERLPISDAEIPLLNLPVTSRLRYLVESDLAGRRRFSFVDSRQVLDSAGVTQRFWPAAKLPGPVVVPDTPREQLRGYFTQSGDDECTGCGGPIGLTYDGQVFRLWYSGMPGPIEAYPHWAVAYAESDDGIEWRKPSLGLVRSLDGSLDNNLTNLIQNAVTVIDLGEDADPEKRYRAEGKGACIRATGERGVYREHWPLDAKGRQLNGMCLLYSSDGLDWKYFQETPVYISQDSGCLVFDRPRNRFLASLKLEIRERGYDRRSHCLTASADGFQWELPRVTLVADEKDDRMALDRGFVWADFQNIGIFPTRDVLIGFLEVSNYSEGFYPSFPHGHRLGFYGKIETQLMYSYDGFHWRRTPERRPLIPWGEEGAWDEGGAWKAKTAVEVGDDVFIYYEGFKGDHSYAFDRCIGLARMKRDRWASFSAAGRGMVEVFHGRVEGPEMTVNARSANGTVRVEALENALAPKPILGFDRASCVPFTGDEIRHPVRWKNKTFAELEGREDVVFRFQLEAADLFAYEVHSSKAKA